MPPFSFTFLDWRTSFIFLATLHPSFPKYSISIKDERIPFNNNVDFCVGTGRMDLALHKEYLDQIYLLIDEYQKDS